MNFALHVVPQPIAEGEELTEPCPFLVTVKVNVGGGLATNVAVTDRACDMATAQVPVPEQAPLQPLKLYPYCAAAVRVTTVPELKDELHVVPQPMPEGDELTEPKPTLLTDSE